MRNKSSETLKDLEKVIASESRHEIITFIEGGNYEEIAKLLEKYVAEKEMLERLYLEERYANNFFFIVSTVLLKAKNNSKTAVSTFDKLFYEKVKDLTTKFSPPSPSYGTIL